MRAGRRSRGRRCQAVRRTTRARPCAGPPPRPGEPEDPLLAAVGVEPDDVPTPGVADDAPRLEVPGGGARRSGTAVVELHRRPLLGGLPEHVERWLVGRQSGLGDVQRGLVDLDAEGGELADRLGRRVREAGVLPDPGGQTDDRGLVGCQRDVGQRQPVRTDPVAGLVVEVGVHVADLDGHAEAAQLFLVALEHLLEGLGGGVRVEELADPVLADEVPLDQQHDQQVQQALALASCGAAAHAADPSRWIRMQPGCRPRSTTCRCP